MYINLEDSIKNLLPFLLKQLKKNFKSIFKNSNDYNIFELDEEQLKITNPDIIGETINFYQKKIMKIYYMKQTENRPKNRNIRRRRIRKSQMINTARKSLKKRLQQKALSLKKGTHLFTFDKKRHKCQKRSFRTIVRLFEIPALVLLLLFVRFRQT